MCYSYSWVVFCQVGLGKRDWVSCSPVEMKCVCVTVGLVVKGGY